MRSCIIVVSLHYPNTGLLLSASFTVLRYTKACSVDAECVRICGAPDRWLGEIIILGQKPANRRTLRTAP